MAWHQISVISNEETAPKIADYFGDLGAVSVTYMDAEDEPVYEPAIGETKIWTNTQVIALYELTADPARIRSQMLKHFHQESLNDWRFEVIQDQAWERAWMEHYRPMKFADKLWVCPTGQEQREENTVCLILDPGLAFGTGTHPTTALCLEWLASHDLKGKTIIDYGCGSGILAIAAVLLGAKIAYAVDIDPQAITATQSNAEKNNVQDKILPYLPEQFKLINVKADVVLANILAKPLIEMAGQITGLMVSKGQLVLSGILSEQAHSVTTAYSPFLPLTEPVQQEDWVRLAGSKP
ncbi:ribosomal protein L11 methyltransferase PrmA [Methyloglobulus morosus KoM1]|uniref:Ribosomal protein L11 methyltransferase n=1 Tax=Methyloglobulus morosus KoM1 TaxID=1116472 RepID=V5BSZ7_9GAMM|nr:50S ribosomal protein L11 methyltransferase [Methyloglobulus morosus]ESS70999.1 ribosomal protein L11 methyltransferase PrmA [Methyloglobulus morosus KoM1]